jgi:hypothetical protein
MEVRVTRKQLSDKLYHLDPGANLTVPEEALAHIFDVISLSYNSHDALRRIADFALEHRCTFSFHEREGAVPCFRKDDIF